MNLPLNEAQLIEFAKKVELSSTRVLEGVHRSRRGAEGVEFHSSLPFSQGEDVRRIDWKRYASSDRLYVQKFQREERTAWTFVLDSSESMNYGKKREWANLWAACMCFLAQYWGDTWRCGLVEEQNLQSVFKRIQTGHIGLPPESFNQIDCLPNSRIVVLSDFFFDLELLENWLSRIESFKDVCWIQIVDPLEKNFSFEGVLQYLDLESRDKLVLDSRAIRKKYLETFRNQQEDLQQILGSAKYQLSVVESSPVEEHLVKFYEAL